MWRGELLGYALGPHLGRRSYNAYQMVNVLFLPLLACMSAPPCECATHATHQHPFFASKDMTMPLPPLPHHTHPTNPTPPAGVTPMTRRALLVLMPLQLHWTHRQQGCKCR
jgi:hypothetical protein